MRTEPEAPELPELSPSPETQSTFPPFQTDEVHRMDWGFFLFVWGIFCFCFCVFFGGFLETPWGFNARIKID